MFGYNLGWTDFWVSVFAGIPVKEFEDTSFLILAGGAILLMVVLLFVGARLKWTHERRKNSLFLCFIFLAAPSLTVVQPVANTSKECKRVTGQLTTEAGTQTLPRVEICRVNDGIGGTWQAWQPGNFLN